MMEGSSLRIIVGTYSALGTLEEMSCKWEKKEQQHEEKAAEPGQKHKTVPCSAVVRCYSR